MKGNEGNRNLQEGKKSQPAGIWKKSEAPGQWVDKEPSKSPPPLKQIASILLKEFEKISNREWKLIKVIGTSRKARKVNLRVFERNLMQLTNGLTQNFLQWSPPLKQISSILLEECEKFL